MELTILEKGNNIVIIPAFDPITASSEGTSRSRGRVDEVLMVSFVVGFVEIVLMVGFVDKALMSLQPGKSEFRVPSLYER